MRLTVKDVARVAVAVDVSGGVGALSAGRRLRRLTSLFNACRALRLPPFHFPDPLLEVRLFRVGGAIFAQVSGVLLEPVSGQGALPMAVAQTGGLAQTVLTLDPTVFSYAAGPTI